MLRTKTEKSRQQANNLVEHIFLQHKNTFHSYIKNKRSDKDVWKMIFWFLCTQINIIYKRQTQANDLKEIYSLQF